MSYETFDHTADLGLRVRAPDLATLFIDAARGLFSMIVREPGTVRPADAVSIELDASALDLLLFDWLSELVYLYETRHLLLGEFDVQLSESHLTAIARGEPVDRQRHELEHEVKAITYHGLKVEQTSHGWLAEVIVDI
ncbi:MAG TPA: archease [Pirellulales bacterium]|jgi:SHS2 domain-containing protein|nr:archease [Pirellulales bacterium]